MNNNILNSKLSKALNNLFGKNKKGRITRRVSSKRRMDGFPHVETRKKTSSLIKKKYRGLFYFRLY